MRVCPASSSFLRGDEEAGDEIGRDVAVFFHSAREWSIVLRWFHWVSDILWLVAFFRTRVNSFCWVLIQFNIDCGCLSFDDDYLGLQFL